MTEPTPSSRWSQVRQGLAAARSRFNPLVAASVVVGLALLVGLAVWVNSLTVPTHREGRPTASVSPLPERTTATPTPTPSGTGTTATESPEPTPSSDRPKLKSSGKFDTAGVDVAASGSSGTLRRYAVRVETSVKLSADKVGRQVAGVLNDPRSWTGSGNLRFALVADPKDADFTITLASLKTVRDTCAPEPSTCTDSGDVAIDASAWLAAPADYPSASAWQAYLVNHAVGHLLGEGHEGCSKSGRTAPAMMPQEGSLKGCTPNPWPFP